MPTVKEKFGFIPYSVWHIESRKYWMNIVKDTGDPTGKMRHSGTMGKYRYSEFNPDVAERIIRFWSEEGDKIVDPCSGRSTRSIVSIMLGRNYEGYEIAPKTYEMTQKRLDLIKKGFNPKGSFKLFNADGTELEHTPDESADLVFTCPPYHQQEKYESFPGQLSDISDYNTFLGKIGIMAQNIYRVLKDGKFLVWVIGDWRADGEYVTFHSDSIEIFKSVGFKLWDIIINELDVPWGSIGVGEYARHYHVVKSHEFILVFRKGNGKPRDFRFVEYDKVNDYF